MNYQPKECKQYKGYYYIPGFSTYVCNLNGEVIRITTGRTIHPTFVDGYYSYHLQNDYGQHKYLRRGRMLCIVFKPVENMDELMIDHVNCIKTDDRLDNLEWVTNQENTRRAGANGLMGVKVPVIVREYSTKRESYYPSKAAAARAVGISIQALDYRLESRDGRVFPEGNQYRYAYKQFSVSDEEDFEIEHILYGNCKRVVLRDLSTGNVREYDRLSDAAKALKMPLPTLSTYISRSKDKQPVLPGLYQLKFVNDKRDWIDPEDPWIALKAITGCMPIQVTNVTSGVTKIYESQVECAKDRGILTTTLNNRLKLRPNTTVYKDGCRYGYYPY